jgi:hypothetical protein
MINCRNCINWVDESLDQVEADYGAHSHIFMGCRLFGYIEGNEALPHCSNYCASENLFAICNSCHVTVPKVCLSLGECVNCTDTDLFCIDKCMGSENRKYCTHFVRLHFEGIHVIDKDRVYDLFPTLGMPGQEQDQKSNTSSSKNSEPENAKPHRNRKPGR